MTIDVCSSRVLVCVVLLLLQVSYSFGLSDNTYSDVLGLYNREPSDDNFEMCVNIANY